MGRSGAFSAMCRGARVIRCRFIFSGKNDGLTPDFPLRISLWGLTPQSPAEAMGRHVARLCPSSPLPYY